MTWLIKPFVAAAILGALTFLASMTKAEHASLQVRILFSALIGTVQFVAWALIIRADQRRGTAEPDEEGKGGEGEADQANPEG